MITSIKLKIGIIFFLILTIKAFSLRVPYVYFFPVSPSFSFSLISEKSNTIDVTSRVRLPDDEEASDFVFLYWDIKLNLNQQKFAYSLQMTVESNGDVLLSQIDDNSIQRMIEPPVLVFPSQLELNNPISIGERLTLKYTKRLGTLTLKDSAKIYNDVVLADLNFGNFPMTLYIAKENGIVAIKTQDETFKAR